MASDGYALSDEANQREFLQAMKDLGVPVSAGPRLKQTAVPLRPDDEDMIAEAAAWGNEKKVGQKGIMVLTHIEHKRAVIKRLREEGFRPIQSDNLEAPNGAMLYVRTSGDMMSGIAVDRLWIHPDCPPRVSAALLPCLRKHD